MPGPRRSGRASGSAWTAATQTHCWYPDDSFDRVVSSFALHHVPRTERPGALREARRVLRPGGTVHILDLDPHHGRGWMARLIHPSLAGQGGTHDPMLDALQAAGFDAPLLRARRAGIAGGMTYHEARVAR